MAEDSKVRSESALLGLDVDGLEMGVFMESVRKSSFIISSGSSISVSISGDIGTIRDIEPWNSLLNGLGDFTRGKLFCFGITRYEVRMSLVISYSQSALSELLDTLAEDDTGLFRILASVFCTSCMKKCSMCPDSTIFMSVPMQPIL